MRSRRLVCAVVAVTLAATGCSTTLTGRAVSVFDDPFSVAGMPATDGPTGLRPDPEPATRAVEGTDGSDVDHIAGLAVSDVEEFWHSAYPDTFSAPFVPVAAVVSWDATRFDGIFCGDTTFALVNAAYCYPDRALGWDRSAMLPDLQRAYGDMGVAMVLAHEYGHAVSRLSGLTDDASQTLLAEQQADCFSGAYLRWVAEGNSPRFTLNTGEGLNAVLAGVIAFRDPVLYEDDLYAGVDEHGSAFERLSAFQFGFTDGPSACASIDLREIAQRRGDLPTMLGSGQTGELPVTEFSVHAFAEAINVIFAPRRPPAVRFDSRPVPCADVRPSPPVSFCPTTNSVAVDLEGLVELGGQAHLPEPHLLATGDNVAYSALVSRFMLALQHERGARLDSAAAALRTACLTGVATAKMAADPHPSGADSVVLTAGDVDEAVSGILTNGLAASDVNGDSVPAGFSRIDAFRVGVLGDTDRCFARFG
ncbi:peptidase [Mycolicibacterium duvalii]|uniref:Peptidase n=1 Tax=Mycolicibacterium duvalii TaxID=39688 RepID=A0A7I7JWP5_9MYCO|nr:peptidase [Mycolicibacterium duvalii]MCV7365889.1 peptidase [Mycolicibacterium duvalii]PEG36298.1 peptidase [Mycolicibacterium duvalii]BBX15512.1 peptidase [Mycolicibacterium duvalii]